MTSYDDPDDVLARIQQDVATAQRRAEQARQAQEAIAAVRGTGRSPRGEVTVEVDAAGALRDLQLTDGALQYRARDLEAMILEAVRVAQHDAAARAIAVAEDAWGEGDPAVEHLRAELQERQAAR
ncbi:hypothetical protein N869_14640 [Cellulomonas bogoriensis 69B4 = DSM 16987]|uniref:YbaB/EbfC DNA-binding family protein n=1 Tax=Cellulomonas bogoriensis 69B4 = DSM 16987 TaxID=1386082 RepID=A0A0A0BXR2_9CELL|nr:hypothetical protein N869_14640 [Cellulomonas bogoriensis 69B4 = DSM 16987]